MFFLLKTEPGTYSFADLQRDKQTVWDGVTNPAAVKNLREMKAGDQLIIYHTGDEKRAVGTATVISVDAGDPKKPLVKIKSGKALASPKTLAEMKADTRFKDSPLIRQSRLSVVPLTDTQHKFLLGSK
jgi:predicted RNA-binding protein with PUA-like domain